MADGREGWWTKVYPEGEALTIPDAAMRYRARNVPLIVLGGRNFGAGMIHWLVAKTPQERRQVIAAIGPLLTTLAQFYRTWPDRFDMLAPLARARS